MQDKISKSLQGKEHVLGVFIDFEKAYDMIHVPTLMGKIRDLGVIGKMYDWVKDFLTDRTFQVKVGPHCHKNTPWKTAHPKAQSSHPYFF